MHLQISGSLLWLAALVLCLATFNRTIVLSSPIPDEDNGDIETLASDLIEVMLNRPLQGQQNSLEVGKAVKRQEELLNATLERSLGKRQQMEGWYENKTAVEDGLMMVKRGDVMALEVIDLASRQLETALQNATLSLGAEKRQAIEQQVFENRQLINATLEAVKRQLSTSDNVTLRFEQGLMMTKRQVQDMWNDTTTEKRQELNNLNETLVEKRQEQEFFNDTVMQKGQELDMFNDTVMDKRQDTDMFNDTSLEKRQEFAMLNDTVMEKRQENYVLNDTLVEKRQDDNDTITMIFKRQDLLSLNETMGMLEKRQASGFDNESAEVVEKRQENGVFNDSGIIEKRQLAESFNDSDIMKKRQESGLFNGSSEVLAKRQESGSLDESSGTTWREECSRVIGNWLRLTERQVANMSADGPAVGKRGVNVGVRAMAARSLAQMMSLPETGFDLDLDMDRVKDLMDQSAEGVREGMEEGKGMMMGWWDALKQQIKQATLGGGPESEGEEEEEGVWFDSNGRSDFDTEDNWIGSD